MVIADPDLTYAGWAEHVDGCARCAGAGELAPDHLCARGRQRLEAWLASEPAVTTLRGASPDQAGIKFASIRSPRIDPEPAPA